MIINLIDRFILGGLPCKIPFFRISGFLSFAFHSIFLFYLLLPLSPVFKVGGNVPLAGRREGKMRTTLVFEFHFTLPPFCNPSHSEISNSMILQMNSSTRILRATRTILAGDEMREDNYHEDFQVYTHLTRSNNLLHVQVPAFLLRVSEVWEPLVDESDSIMISEDGVVVFLALLLGRAVFDAGRFPLMTR